ncbi:MAG: hypothetical protein U0172_08380 [Nitrospiraceae bacterium]
MAHDLTAPSSLWQERIASGVRYGLAPLLFLWSGFFTTDFIFSGAYTWPRTSRVFVLTLTLFILAYEFVYKAALTSTPPQSEAQARRLVRVTCLIPYAVGILLLVLIVVVRR